MTDATMPKLNIEGRVGYPIWTMADGPDSAPIGLRLDCGDAGVVYMTAEQARAIAQDLVAIADELEKPACSPQESTCSGVESAGETHDPKTCTHFWRTVERNFQWITECENCGIIGDVEGTQTHPDCSPLRQSPDALRDARPPKEPKRYTLSEINPGWRCPDCDGTEVISSGPQRFICDRCFLTAKLDTAEARNGKLVEALAQIHECGSIGEAERIAKKAMEDK